VIDNSLAIRLVLINRIAEITNKIKLFLLRYNIFSQILKLFFAIFYLPSTSMKRLSYLKKESSNLPISADYPILIVPVNIEPVLIATNLTE
jgi:hypothetical protein